MFKQVFVYYTDYYINLLGACKFWIGNIPTKRRSEKIVQVELHTK